MIKFWKNKKQATSEQEKRVWDQIDSLYLKLEEGKATKDELKQIDGISKTIMATIKRKKTPATEKELDALVKRDLDMLRRTIGIEGRTDYMNHQLKNERKFLLHSGLKYVGAGIAASVLLMLGISLYMDNKTPDRTNAIAYSIIKCQKDSVLHLPDGTIVYLAGGSDLRIAKDFGKKDRRIDLSGEAFFEVAKDKKKAFIVKTKEVKAIVHGTSFNVVAYNGTPESQVTIRTGCVEVGKGEQSFGKFYRGDRIVYDRINKAVLHDTVDPDNIGAWRNGGFILEDASIEELKARVKNRFQRELVVTEDAIPVNARINYCSYKTAQTGIDTVIKNICAIYGARYEINDNRIIISR